jgi:hypothetical protein
MGLPNCLRSFACPADSAMSRFIAPMAPPPRPLRPLLRMFMATLKPPFLGPSRWSCGTSTSSRYTVQVELARMPILSSCAPTETPAMSRVTMNADRCARSPGGPVFAKTVKKSAMPALVIQIFEPLRTKPSAVSSAVVRTEAASEPAPSSVRQNAAIISPVASFS